MPRKQKKYHFIYKTTNLINKKYYIGMHSTNNLNDGYIGSGKRLWNSVKKYGKENFKCEILEFLPNRIELKEREKEMINENILKDKMCMNLMCGGQGGFISEEQQKYRSICAAKANILKLKNDSEYKKRHSEWTSKNAKKLHKEKKLIHFDWTGRTHKLESIEKMRKSSKGMGLGEKNSQFGTMWITNGIENKKIKKDEIIPDGWKLGRTINLIKK